MKKLVTVTLVFLLALLISQVALGYSVSGVKIQKPQYTLPQQPQYGPPRTQNDQCLGQDPHVQNEPCCGQDPILINGELHDAEERLQDALTNYSDLSASTYHSNSGIKTFNSFKNRYELCFAFPEGPVDVDSTITIAPVSGETKGLAVYGLNLRPDTGLSTASLVEVNFPKSVLIDLSMTDVINGLLVKSETEIDKATITGAAGGGGSCVELNDANNTVIQGSVISQCDVGIMIDGVLDTDNDGNVDGTSDVRIGADLAANFYQQNSQDIKNANEIKDNGIGIHIISGQRIKHGFNLNYRNDRVASSYLNAIVIEDGQNTDAGTLNIVETNVKGKSYNLYCDKSSGNAYVKFNKTGGEVQLYQAGTDARQAKRFIFSCPLDSEGKCLLDDLPDFVKLDIAECDFRDDQNKKLMITAIFTLDSSSQLMDPKQIDGLPPVIFAESEGAEIPTAPAEDDLGSGEEVSLASATGSGDGGGGEIAALGAKGGCMGGSSLLPNDVESTYAPHLGAWWIIFSIALLASLRFAKVRTRRRK